MNPQLQGSQGVPGVINPWDVGADSATNYLQPAYNPQLQGGFVQPQAAPAPAPNPYYGQVSNAYGGAVSALDSNTALSRQMVDQGYNSQFGQINSDYQSGQANIGRSRELVQERQAATLRDLANSIRSAFERGQQMLGNMGAADSSASEIMLPYALTKMQNQNRGQVMSQANSQYKDIDLQSADWDRQHEQAQAQLNTWKQTQLMQIAQDYNDRKVQIELAKANATTSAQYAAYDEAAQSNLQAALAAMGSLDQQGSVLGASIAPSGGMDLTATNFRGGDLRVGQSNPTMNLVSGAFGAGPMDLAVNPFQGQQRQRNPWELA